MITVNGKKMRWESGMTITAIIERLNYVFPMVVVKVNGSVVKREDFPILDVPDGASVEIIHLISGG